MYMYVFFPLLPLSLSPQVADELVKELSEDKKTVPGGAQLVWGYNYLFWWKLLSNK